MATGQLGASDEGVGACACCAVLSGVGGNVLGCPGDDPLESLNLSLGLHRIALTCHLLFTKASIVDTIWIIEEEARFLVLATGHQQR